MIRINLLANRPGIHCYPALQLIILYDPDIRFRFAVKVEPTSRANFEMSRTWRRKVGPWEIAGIADRG